MPLLQELHPCNSEQDVAETEQNDVKRCTTQHGSFSELNE
jgi:hypothetical protein